MNNRTKILKKIENKLNKLGYFAKNESYLYEYQKKLFINDTFYIFIDLTIYNDFKNIDIEYYKRLLQNKEQLFFYINKYHQTIIKKDFLIKQIKNFEKNIKNYFINDLKLENEKNTNMFTNK